MYYILVDKEVVLVNDINEWSKQWSKSGGTIALHNFGIKGDILVSTVFLGINHRCGEGVPVLFETMVFGGKHSDLQRRYCTYDEAIEGHNNICELVDEVRIKRDTKINDLGL